MLFLFPDIPNNVIFLPRPLHCVWYSIKKSFALFFGVLRPLGGDNRANEGIQALYLRAKNWNSFYLSTSILIDWYLEFFEVHYICYRQIFFSCWPQKKKLEMIILYVIEVAQICQSYLYLKNFFKQNWSNEYKKSSSNLFFIKKKKYIYTIDNFFLCCEILTVNEKNTFEDSYMVEMINLITGHLHDWAVFKKYLHTSRTITVKIADVKKKKKCVSHCNSMYVCKDVKYIYVFLRDWVVYGRDGEITSVESGAIITKLVIFF